MIGGLKGSTDSVPGPIGTALDFDGVDDGIYVPHNAALNPAAITYAAWVNARGFGGYEHVLQKQEPGITGYGLMLDGHNMVSFIAINNNWSRLTSPATLSANRWYHVATTWDGTTHILYIDGVEVARGTPSGSFSASPDDFYIGQRNNSSDYWNGKIDDIRVYNRALSAMEILALSGYTGGNCQNPTGTPGSLRFNSASHVMQYCDGAIWRGIGR